VRLVCEIDHGYRLYRDEALGAVVREDDRPAFFFHWPRRPELMAAQVIGMAAGMDCGMRRRKGEK
jgi:hypothetical protein